MAAATEMSVAALAINSLAPPTGAPIATNVLVPQIDDRTRQKMLVLPSVAQASQIYEFQNCPMYTDKHRIFDVRGRPFRWGGGGSATPDYAVPW